MPTPKVIGLPATGTARADQQGGGVPEETEALPPAGDPVILSNADDP